MKIDRVAIPKKRITYLEERWLVKQFEKATTLICHGYVQSVQLKLRQPKSDNIYYFRINKQFRAWCTLEGSTLIVFHIDNHQ